MKGAMRSFVFLACLLVTGLAQDALSEDQEEVIDSSVLEASGAMSEFKSEDIEGVIATMEPDLPTDEDEEVTDDDYIAYFFAELTTAASSTVDPKDDPNVCLHRPPGLPDCALPEEFESLESEEEDTTKEQTTKGQVYYTLRDGDLVDITILQQNIATPPVFIRNESKVFYLKGCSPAKEYPIPLCTGDDPVQNADEVRRLYAYYIRVPADRSIDLKTSKLYRLRGPNKIDSTVPQHKGISEEAPKQTDNGGNSATTNTPTTSKGSTGLNENGNPTITKSVAPLSAAENEVDLDNEETANRMLTQFINDWQKKKAETDTGYNGFTDPSKTGIFDNSENLESILPVAENEVHEPEVDYLKKERAVMDEIMVESWNQYYESHEKALPFILNSTGRVGDLRFGPPGSEVTFDKLNFTIPNLYQEMPNDEPRIYSVDGLPVSADSEIVDGLPVSDEDVSEQKIKSANFDVESNDEPITGIFVGLPTSEERVRGQNIQSASSEEESNNEPTSPGDALAAVASFNRGIGAETYFLSGDRREAVQVPVYLGAHITDGYEIPVVAQKENEK